MEFPILEWTEISGMKKETNYRKWSFKFLIYAIILNGLIAFIIVRSLNETTLKIQLPGFEVSKNNTDTYLIFLTILTNLIFVAGLVLTILCFKNKEVKDYKYKISMYGYPIFIMLSILTLFL